MKKLFFNGRLIELVFFPMKPEDLNEHYEKQKDNADFLIFTACDENMVPVGHMFMRYLAEEHRTIRFGFVIVNDKLRGKGYGKEMLLQAKKYAVEFLHVKEITLGVFANNPNAFQCYQAVGFEEYGERTVYMINGIEWECIEIRCSFN